MAGVGFTLKKLAKRGSLVDILQDLGYSSLISCGPWLLTITCLGGITWLSALKYDQGLISRFGIIVIYNFSFSLVIFGPLVLVASRYLADCLYAKRTDTISGLCIGSMTIVYVGALATAVPFYFLATDLSDGLATGAVVNYVLISMMWITSLFLQAIKRFGLTVFVFFICMVVSFFLGVYLSRDFEEVGMLWGFNAGLFVFVYATLGIILSQYRDRLQHPWAFLTYFGKFANLAAIGLIYNMAIWIDKWIMWFAADNTEVQKAMVFNPTYDLPMFLAYLSIVPAMTLFTYYTESHFFDLYQRFYRDIKQHQAYSWISRRCNDMVTCVYQILGDIIIVQAVIALLTIAFSPSIVELAGGEFRQLAIFRVGVLGSFLHVMFLFIVIFLLYFDLRVITLCLQVFFLLANGILTYVSINLGYAFYGYGYFLASLICCVVSFIVLMQVLKRLPYITFVSNNPSVR